MAARRGAAGWNLDQAAGVGLRTYREGVVSYDHVSRGVHRHVLWTRPSGADEGLAAGSCAAGRDFHDLVEAAIGNEEIASSIHRHASEGITWRVVQRELRSSIGGNLKNASQVLGDEDIA